MQKQLRALEENFLTLEGGLDTPERQEMWPQLASLNAQLNSVDDAGVCWMNALWERDEQATRAWSWHWFASEAANVPTRQETSRSAAKSWVSRVIAAGAKTPRSVRRRSRPADGPQGACHGRPAGAGGLRHLRRAAEPPVAGAGLAPGSGEPIPGGARKALAGAGGVAGVDAFDPTVARRRAGPGASARPAAGTAVSQRPASGAGLAELPALRGPADQPALPRRPSVDDRPGGNWPRTGSRKAACPTRRRRRRPTSIWCSPSAWPGWARATPPAT